MVPGEWCMQGFKVDSAAFDRYQKNFEVPQDWKDKQVILGFDGVHSEYKVFVNHRQVASHLEVMTREVNITDALQDGTNVLSLQVRSESLADMLGSLTQYAAHQLGGITRKVTLFAVPDIHLSDAYSDRPGRELSGCTSETLCSGQKRLRPSVPESIFEGRFGQA